ncbi:hypothetical protein [Actibacterium sp. XHP0104]|uniref:hypothetical protein n=1 Tax=Actibacterium sp. XHP0104 TaxID=2984335 RepID=UPI0021E7AB97|nr:hypothetical protein [Actibacterium sp. XHP0104]MCV2880684.1 hypothetical protein [Actibacterium sp. XHP0104]
MMGKTRKMMITDRQDDAGLDHACVAVAAGRTCLNADITETYDVRDEGRLERMAKMAVCKRFTTVLRDLMVRSHSRVGTCAADVQGALIRITQGFHLLYNCKADLGRIPAMRGEYRVGV